MVLQEGVIGIFKGYVDGSERVLYYTAAACLGPARNYGVDSDQYLCVPFWFRNSDGPRLRMQDIDAVFKSTEWSHRGYANRGFLVDKDSRYSDETPISLYAVLTSWPGMRLDVLRRAARVTQTVCDVLASSKSLLGVIYKVKMDTRGPRPFFKIENRPWSFTMEALEKVEDSPFFDKTDAAMYPYEWYTLDLKEEVENSPEEYFYRWIERTVVLTTRDTYRRKEVFDNSVIAHI